MRVAPQFIRRSQTRRPASRSSSRTCTGLSATWGGVLVIRVLPGDCREVLATLPADSVDAT